MLAHRSNYSQKAHVLQFLHLHIIPGDCYFKASLTGKGRNYCLNPVCRWMLMSSWCSSRTLLWYWMINCFKWYQISFSKEQFFNWLNRPLKVKIIGHFFQVAISSTKHITTSFDFNTTSSKLTSTIMPSLWSQEQVQMFYHYSWYF